MLGIEKIRKYLGPLTKEREGIFVYLPKVSDYQKKEIEFHNAVHQDEEEIHQLSTVRNKFYHNYFKKWLYKLLKDSVILEIGGGSGFDLLPLLQRGYSMIESDISVRSIKSVKIKIDNQFPQYKNQIIYLVADGQNLPLPDNSVEATFMVATLHHFEKQKKILTEISRVTKNGGLIIFAMEPSKFMMWFTKLFSKTKKLRIYQGYSEADETHPGYSKRDWRQITDNEFLIMKLKRVWLLLGFLHYGLEAIFRLFKLKKRIKVPRLIECLLLIIDEILLKIPLINQLHWHWILIIKNL